MQVIVCVLILRVLFLVAYVKHILFNTTQHLHYLVITRMQSLKPWYRVLANEFPHKLFDSNYTILFFAVTHLTVSIKSRKYTLR